MIRPNATIRVLLAGLVFCVSAPASATLMGYSFAGNGGTTGSFIYDDASASIGTGFFGGTAYSAEFVFDGVDIVPGEVAIFTDFFGDQFILVTDSTDGLPVLQLAHFGLDLFASDAASELNGLTLADFDITVGNFIIFSSGAEQVVSFESFSVAEPGTLGLLGAGLIALLLRRRRVA